MDVALFDYDLPEELIAQYPIDKRDESRLMVLNRKDRSIIHSKFRNLPDFLSPGDLLVLNNTRVIPARLIGEKEGSKVKVEMLLLSQRGDALWEALVKRSSRLKAGTKVMFGGGEFTAIILDKTEFQTRLVQFESEAKLKELLKKYGRTPLPPYIKREGDIKDMERYQTIYAKEEGSVAAPTAGLHFTEPLFASLRSKGIDIVEITLHIGLGTFQPVKVNKVENHKMHEEYFHISEEVSNKINQTRASGGRIIAVGTTVVRALESSVDDAGKIKPYKGFTNKFIYPGYTIRSIDGLITNFHLPRSTLLMLVSAFAGREYILEAYKEAIKERYRFYSYGDAMLIL